MIIMAGVDYNLAAVEEREKISYTDETALFAAYDALKQTPKVLGSVILSTCNRTELYLSVSEEISAFALLRNLSGTEGVGIEHYEYSGMSVMEHLCKLGSGIKSQIRGEDQILAQVKDAITTARKRKACDSRLEVMFRDSIAAAKEIKTEISLGEREDSIVTRALDVLGRYSDVRRVLVIGNGEIGRLAARALVLSGYYTVMTRRTYRHGVSDVPEGAETCDYDRRYAVMLDCDAVISATRSPHHTAEVSKVKELRRYPKLWLDLAIPRDIDPEIAALRDVECYDVDSISGGVNYTDEAEKLERADKIAQSHMADFKKWLSYQKRLTGESGKKEYFPLFIPVLGKRALIVGGGKVAARRVETLLQFSFDITVVAPEVMGSIESFYKNGQIELIEREFCDADLDGCFMAVAATGERDVNRRIGKLAKERGIFVSVADKRDECGFLFPAIALSGDITAGLTSGGNSHHAVSDAARKIREVLN